ncbi:MAG: IreB family regulatory phosphoprotein [Ruminococcus sp.]|nr:IreB family regulatory phosphoprotein [Ruminococcus sp.]
MNPRTISAIKDEYSNPCIALSSTYITTYNNARNIISKIDRDDLLEALVKSYLNV